MSLGHDVLTACRSARANYQVRPNNNPKCQYQSQKIKHLQCEMHFSSGFTWKNDIPGVSYNNNIINTMRKSTKAEQLLLKPLPHTSLICPFSVLACPTVIFRKKRSFVSTTMEGNEERNIDFNKCSSFGTKM